MANEDNVKNSEAISPEKISEIILNELSEEEKQEKLEQLKKNSRDEEVVFEVTRDKMTLYAMFHEPLGIGKHMNFKEFCEIIKEKYGLSSVKFTELKPIFDSRKFKLRTLIGTGTHPISGKDGHVIYHFDTNNVPKVKILENGKADWFDRGIVHNVHKDELLVSLTEGEKGTQGRDVYGNIINPIDGRTPAMPKSVNTYLSEDGLNMYASKNGRVILRGKEIVVDDKIVLPNIDNESGNIIFAGDIHVKGDVLSNFTVEAEGDIIVEGIIEGATLIAGGNIEFKRGINGNGKGYVKCGGSFRASFVESSEIIVGEDIVADSVINSTLMAGNKIVIEGKKGLLVGGEARARNSIYAENAGNDFFVRTLLEVGVDIDVLIKLDDMEKKVKKISEENRAKAEAENVTLHGVRKNYHTGAVSKEISETMKIIEELKNRVYIASDASITIGGMIYPKVFLRICGISYENKANNAKSEYRVKDGEVQSFPCL